MPRRSAARKKDVAFLHAKQIEAEANLLIEEYESRFEEIISPPIPVDEIAELHLQLTLEYLDMKSLFEHADVHGAIWFGEGRIGIEQSLDPDSNPSKRGRYHFTLGHEIGHWRLHRSHYLENPLERKLFGDGTPYPDVICRSKERKLPVEWQADSFSACLLMPRKMVCLEWTDFRDGNDQSMAIGELRKKYAAETVRYRGRVVTDQSTMDLAMKEEFCRPLAERFEVSREAMRIRLETLELLVTKKENTLF